MRALIDADSIVHKAWYVVENQPLTDSEKIAEGLEVIASMEMSMFNEAEDELGVCFDGFEYFFTTCTKNFRKDLVDDYKATRKEKNPLLYVLLREYMESVQGDIHYSDTKEADDLIPEIIKLYGLKPTEYCIFRIDKDIAQIEGFHFNYQKVDYINENGEKTTIGTKTVTNKKGEVTEKDVYLKVYKGLEYISKKEAFKNFCVLLLVGDGADNIKGISGIGEIKSNQRLKNKSMFGMWRKVVEAYLKEEAGKERLKINVKLMRLN